MATPQQIAQIRYQAGAPADPASDAIWAQRIAAGTHTLAEASRRIRTERGDLSEALRRQDPNYGRDHLGDYLEANPGTPGSPIQLPIDRNVLGGGGSPSQPAEDPAIAQRRASQNIIRELLGWLPPALLNAYVNEWIETNDPELAWGKVRMSPEYDVHFPGNRKDGRILLSEQEYVAHREAFFRAIAQRGFNPEMFASHHPQLVQGAVSVNEFNQRLDAKIEGVMQNLPEVRERFGQFYGVNAMDDNALIAAALDPDIGLSLLQGRVTAAQVAGEAAIQGFMRGREAAERLVNAGGLDQLSARQFFSTAARAVPQTDRFARRFNDPMGGFTIDQFEAAGVFGDVTQQRRRERLVASERSMFNQGGQVRRDNTGLSGLTQR